jgi:hypothetical protein
MTSSNNLKPGQMLVGAIFVIVIFSILGIELASLLSSESYSTIQNYSGVKALNVAEGGVRFTVATSLAATAIWSNSSLKKFGPISFGTGTFSVTYDSISIDDVTFEVAGTVSGITRTIKVHFNKQSNSLGVFADYNVYAGTPGSVGNTLNLYDSTKIIGDFYYYGPISINQSRPPYPPIQTGGEIKSTSISPSSPGGIPYYYSSWEAIGNISPVVWDNTYYNAMLAKVNGASSGSPSGSFTLNNRTITYDAISLYGNYTITGTGTICVKNDFNVGTTTRLTGNLDLIVGGNFSMQDFSSMQGTIEVDVKGTVAMNGNSCITTGAWVYTESSATNWAMALNANNLIQGSVLAPYGGLVEYGNSYIKGLAYSKFYEIYGNSTLEGAGVFLDVGNFYNNSTIIQNGNILPQLVPQGLSSESTNATVSNTYWNEIYP